MCSAWIEENNIKPFEGPWKDELAKVSKPAAFRHAMADIEKYLDNPAEIDEQIDENCGMGGNHATEADFDKIRDGLDSDENLDAASGTGAAAAGGDANNGIVPHVVGSPDESDALPPAPGVENKATSPSVPTTPTAKSQSKRTPKAKSSAAVTVSSKQANKAASAKSAAAQKRRISAQHTPTGGSAKRGRRAASGDVDRFESPGAGGTDYDGASSSSLATRARIETEAFLGTLTKRTPNAIALLDRPVVTRPETQIIDMNSRSNTLADRDIVPSDQTFGFLGLGIMGSTIVKDLIYTGHKVVVWNRTIDKVNIEYIVSTETLLKLYRSPFAVSALRRGWCRGKGHTHGCCGGCRHYILLCIRPEGCQRCKTHNHQSPCLFVVIFVILYFSSFLATAASCS